MPCVSIPEVWSTGTGEVRRCVRHYAPQPAAISRPNALNLLGTPYTRVIAMTTPDGTCVRHEVPLHWPWRGDAPLPRGQQLGHGIACDPTRRALDQHNAIVVPARSGLDERPWLAQRLSRTNRMTHPNADGWQLIGGCLAHSAMDGPNEPSYFDREAEPPVPCRVV